MVRTSSAPVRHSILPSYILRALAQQTEFPELQEMASHTLAVGREIRKEREDYATALREGRVDDTAGMKRQGPRVPTDRPPIGATKYRYCYDLEGSEDHRIGRLVWREGYPEVADAAVMEAVNYAGIVHDFYREVFDRNSLDNHNMPLLSCVHFGRGVANAFWDGQRMVYGDGDGQLFERFTKSLDVVAHEMTHGVQTFTSNLTYYGESGALNEHFSDVFGVVVKQWHLGVDVDQDDANWLVGAELISAMGKTKGIRAIRDMGPQPGYKDSPIGTDIQPKHYDDKYTGAGDRGGVHINSGIPNLAFYRTAKLIGGNAWDAPAKIWYETMIRLPSDADFALAAKTFAEVAGEKYGADSKEQFAVVTAFKEVGVDPGVELSEEAVAKWSEELKDRIEGFEVPRKAKEEAERTDELADDSRDDELDLDDDAVDHDDDSPADDLGSDDDGPSDDTPTDSPSGSRGLGRFSRSRARSNRRAADSRPSIG